MSRTTRFYQLFFLSGLLLLSACAGYRYTNAFFIRNSSAAVITVKISGGSESDTESFDILPGEQRTVHSEQTKCPEGFVPIDRYLPEDLIPPAGMVDNLEIWVDGKQLDGGIRMRVNWDRRATEYSEVYTLYITDALVGQYGGE